MNKQTENQQLRLVRECHRVIVLTDRCNHGDDLRGGCRRCKKYYNRWCRATSRLAAHIKRTHGNFRDMAMAHPPSHRGVTRATTDHRIGEAASRGEFSVPSPWGNCSRLVLDRVKRELIRQGYSIDQDVVSWSSPHLL